MSDLYIYSTPPGADVTLTLDTGATLTGTACTANGRADAHRITLPSGTPTQGSTLRVGCAGYVAFSGRGILETDDNPPRFLFDDVHLTEAAAVTPPTPEPPPLNPNADPLAIINGVYATGKYPLATKTGCGEFTEACCYALYTQQSNLWGHIKKNPGQNQYDGHAVDAVQLLGASGSTEAGIYDIVHDSESPNATPSLNFKGEPDPNLYLPPSPPSPPSGGGAA